ncbi:MAG: hypothetical protein HQK50_17260 [Oligoflexia bacterium]|nr:hypothetical protein [Oligoflexia bacterium]
MAAKKPTIERIHEKLLELLNSEDYKSSERVIDEFLQRYPDDWKKLIACYGDSLDTPGEGARRPYYSAQCYISDRLCDLKKIGKITLLHTEKFNRRRWPYSKKMGTWKIANDHSLEKKINVCVRLPESVFVKVSEISKERHQSISALVNEMLLEMITSRVE